MEEIKRKSGRRGAPVTERRRVPLGIRITPEMRDELVARAEAKGGRSITSQTEILLEQALIIEKMMGTGLRTMIEVLHKFVRVGDQRAEELGLEGDWSGNSECYMAAAASAVQRLLELAPGEWDGKMSLGRGRGLEASRDRPPAPRRG